MKELYNEIRGKLIGKLKRRYKEYLDTVVNVFPGNTDRIIDMFKPYLTFVFKNTLDTDGEESNLSHILLYKKLIELFETSEKYKDYSYQNMIVVCALNQFDDPVNELINRGIENSCRNTIEYINTLNLSSPFWTHFPYREILDKVEDDFTDDLEDVLKEFSFNEMDLSKLIERSHKDYNGYVSQFKESSPEEIIKANRLILFFEVVDQYFSNQYNDNGDELGLQMMRFENPITLLVNHFFDRYDRFSDITSFVDDDGIEILINEICNMFDMDQELNPSDSHSFEEVLREAFPNCFRDEVIEDKASD